MNTKFDLKIFKLIYLFMALIIVISLSPLAFAMKKEANSTTPFAVVELFTSEGCSSCPPADVFLRELTQLAHQDQIRLFTLSFHVDYWNYLGWKDPFSAVQFSQRQKDYAQTLKSTSVYTPQMIINGTHAFGGYNRDMAQKHIDNAFKMPSEVSVDFRIFERTDQELNIKFTVSPMPEDGLLNIALVERDLSSQVTKGENAGQLLKHDNVVRFFSSIRLVDHQGQVRVTLPPDLNPKESSVVIYVQDIKTMRILGAEKKELRNHF